MIVSIAITTYLWSKWSKYLGNMDVITEFIEYTAPIWRNFNLRKLKVDEAYLSLYSLFENVTYLYTLSEECIQCPFTILKELHPKRAEKAAVKVAHPLKFKILYENVGRYAFENNATDICTFDEIEMDEFGVYNLTIDGNGTCEFAEDKPGVNVNLPFLSATILIAVVLIFLKICQCVCRRLYCVEQVTAVETSQSSDTITDSEIPLQQKRIRSLDTFRGMAIVLMIFVNSGGGNYSWMEHAPWNGLHVADIVFPCFLWIMGTCIPLSVKSQLNRNTTKISLCWRIFVRSVKLFLIGLCLNSINGPELSNLRIMGVLQRFGIAYLVCGMLHTTFAEKHFVLPQERWKRMISDIIIMRYQLMTSFVLICIYLGVTFGLDVPGCPKGYLGPGGKHLYAAYPNCIGGATGYIDKLVLGMSHIYQHPTAKYIYDSTEFDPEGLFGCVLTIVQVFIGAQAGQIMVMHPENWSRIKRWMSWSIVLSLLGGTLCLFSVENGLIPINKNLWSLSFVFVTSGFAFFLLAFLYSIVDIWTIWTGWPFAQSGMNAIIMYVGHTIMHKMLPWHWKIGPMNTHFILLLESAWNTLLWIAIALYLDSKRFYYNL